jgi:hypothetical protein
MKMRASLASTDVSEGRTDSIIRVIITRLHGAISQKALTFSHHSRRDNPRSQINNTHFSLYHTVGTFQSWGFGLCSRRHSVVTPGKFALLSTDNELIPEGCKHP